MTSATLHQFGRPQARFPRSVGGFRSDWSLTDPDLRCFGYTLSMVAANRAHGIRRSIAACLHAGDEASQPRVVPSERADIAHAPNSEGSHTTARVLRSQGLAPLALDFCASAAIDARVPAPSPVAFLQG